jgi:hypothetical protein
LLVYEWNHKSEDRRQKSGVKNTSDFGLRTSDEKAYTLLYVS